MDKELETAKKKKLALFISGSISFVILCTWIFFFVREKPLEIVKSGSENGVALFEELKENVGANTAGIKDSIFFIKEKMGIFFTETKVLEQTGGSEDMPVIEE